jgi:hypothetical protein
VSVVDSSHEKIVALEEKASQLDKTGNDASKATLSRSMTTVWQRWTCLRAVAQDQEKILEDAVDEWKGLNNKVMSTTDGRKLLFFSLIAIYFVKLFCSFWKLALRKPFHLFQCYEN